MELTMHAVDELSMPVDSITMTCHHPQKTKLQNMNRFINEFFLTTLQKLDR